MASPFRALIRTTITGTGPWSRRLRHEQRAAMVWAVAEAAIADEQEHGSFITGCHQPQPIPDGGWTPVRLAASLLCWSEANPTHPLGPGKTPPTRRPSWWLAWLYDDPTDNTYQPVIQLPDRRQRSSGLAWNAAAGTAAWDPDGPTVQEAIAQVGEATCNLLVRQERYYDAASLAAWCCETLALSVRAGSSGTDDAAPLLAVFEQIAADQWAASLPPVNESNDDDSFVEDDHGEVVAVVKQTPGAIINESAAV